MVLTGIHARLNRTSRPVTMPTALPPSPPEARNAELLAEDHRRTVCVESDNERPGRATRHKALDATPRRLAAAARGGFMNDADTPLLRTIASRVG
jgi:hypothetical protein